ncbi:protein of unknown function [Shewanella benthica]|uniref:Uncharacterized protein n=1 Tax=Shewanella benthica TaxID=43661 RepID=A0A330LYH0_9GAMM|nr:protein of unknown function [Shewanella benthica]SQH74821.1 protein of unknown function [Shewanella benthica]
MAFCVWVFLNVGIISHIQLQCRQVAYPLKHVRAMPTAAVSFKPKLNQSGWVLLGREGL